jgi:hypothetical protein
VVLNHHDPEIEAATGKVRMRFDPARSFLLTHVQNDWTTGAFSLSHVADVSQARQVQGVWLPEKIIEVTVVTQHKPGTGEVDEVTLVNAQLNALTKKDLDVVFPPNTVYIYDSTSGKKVE